MYSSFTVLVYYTLNHFGHPWTRVNYRTQENNYQPNLGVGTVERNKGINFKQGTRTVEGVHHHCRRYALL
jgi:hypothetical protein